MSLKILTYLHQMDHSVGQGSGFNLRHNGHINSQEAPGTPPPPTPTVSKLLSAIILSIFVRFAPSQRRFGDFKH